MSDRDHMRVIDGDGDDDGQPSWREPCPPLHRADRMLRDERMRDAPPFVRLVAFALLLRCNAYGCAPLRYGRLARETALPGEVVADACGDLERRHVLVHDDRADAVWMAV